MPVTKCPADVVTRSILPEALEPRALLAATALSDFSAPAGRGPAESVNVGDASYFLVKNHINETSFFEWDPATYNSYFKRIKGAEEITIPKLNEMACEQVELASVPFVNFVANKNAKDDAANYSFVLRGYVRHWLGNVWSEFDRVKLIDLIAPKIESNVRQVAS